MFEAASPQLPLGMVLGQLAQRHAVETLRRLGQSFDIRRCGVLLMIGPIGACGQQDIGERLSIDRTTMMRIAREMEAAGLIERQRLPDDQRTIGLALTPQGLALLQQVSTALAEAEETVFGALGPEAHQSLRELAGALHARHWTGELHDVRATG